MTTPQQTLYNISSAIHDLQRSFESREEDGEDYFEKIDRLCCLIDGIQKDMDRLTNTMDLILKVMNKKNE